MQQAGRGSRPAWPCYLRAWACARRGAVVIGAGLQRGRNGAQCRRYHAASPPHSAQSSAAQGGPTTQRSEQCRPGWPNHAAVLSTVVSRLKARRQSISSGQSGPRRPTWGSEYPMEGTRRLRCRGGRTEDGGCRALAIGPCSEMAHTSIAPILFETLQSVLEKQPQNQLRHDIFLCRESRHHAPLRRLGA
jgi:hypothetical protein